MIMGPKTAFSMLAGAVVGKLLLQLLMSTVPTMLLSW